MLNLITDRTQADVEYAKSFQGKEWKHLTDEQKTEYLAGLKGAYSYTDFNRVEKAVEYLSDILNKSGYANRVETKTNWTAEDIQTKAEIQRYLKNIAELKDKYYSSIEGTMPTTETWLTVEGANYIEALLEDIHDITLNMGNMYICSGVANVGQSRIWQHRWRKQVDTLRTWEELTEIYWSDFAENEIWRNIIYD